MESDQHMTWENISRILSNRKTSKTVPYPACIFLNPLPSIPAIHELSLTRLMIGADSAWVFRSWQRVRSPECGCRLKDTLTLDHPKPSTRTTLDYPRSTLDHTRTSPDQSSQELTLCEVICQRAQLPSRQNDTQTPDNCHLNTGRWAQIAIRGSTNFQKSQKSYFW